MTKKKAQPEEWVNGEIASALLTKQSGHYVSPDYVRRLGNSGKLTTKPIDGPGRTLRPTAYSLFAICDLLFAIPIQLKARMIAHAIRCNNASCEN